MNRSRKAMLITRWLHAIVTIIFIVIMTLQKMPLFIIVGVGLLLLTAYQLYKLYTDSTYAQEQP